MALADIDTIVIVLMENRSFDHLLGYLGISSSPGQKQVNGLSDDPTWLAQYANEFRGRGYQSFPLDPGVQEIDDPKHDHGAIAIQIGRTPDDPNLKVMGGFVESYATRGKKKRSVLGDGLLRSLSAAGVRLLLPQVHGVRPLVRGATHWHAGQSAYGDERVLRDFGQRPSVRPRPTACLWLAQEPRHRMARLQVGEVLSILRSHAKHVDPDRGVVGGVEGLIPALRVLRR